MDELVDELIDRQWLPMDWLDPPYQFVTIHPEMPFTIPVVRYEVGLAMRPIFDPPGHRVATTIRFHLPGPAGWRLQPYVDFSNRILLLRVLAIYDDLTEKVLRQIPFSNSERLRQLAPSQPEALTLRLIRHGERIDTIYGVEVVEG